MTHPIPLEALKESVAVVGRTGSGKSYAIRGAVEILLREQQRVCIVDPTGVWHGLRSSASGDKPGFPVVVFGGDHADVPIGDTSGTAVAELLAGRNLPAVLDVSEFTMGARVRFMTAFLDALYRANRNPLTLVIDEADLFAPQRAMPDQTVMLSRMEQIVRRGRVRGFRPWLITQRPAELHKSVLSQANTLIAMQLTAPQDRDAIGAWIEGQADRDEGKKILAELARLKKGEGYVWSPSHDVLKRVRFPAITTFDSSRTPEEGEALPQLTLAAVDLAGITDSLRTVEAEAEGNDPKMLRKRIADLEEQLAKAGNPVAATADQQLADERRIGFELCEAKMREFCQRWALSMAAPLQELEATRASLHGIANSQGGADREPELRKTTSTKPASEPQSVNRPSRLNGSRPTRNVSTDSSVSRSQQRILEALALLESVGIVQPSRTQLALWAEVSPTSGGYFNNLGALRTAGLIDYPAGGSVALTDAGRERAPTPAAPTVGQMQESLCAKVGNSKAAILRALIAIYPRDITRDALAGKIGVSPTSGGYFNNLGALRTLGVIEYPSAGKVVAQPVLFLE